MTTTSANLQTQIIRGQEHVLTLVPGMWEVRRHLNYSDGTSSDPTVNLVRAEDPDQAAVVAATAYANTVARTYGSLGDRFADRQHQAVCNPLPEPFEPMFGSKSVSTIDYDVFAVYAL